MNDIELARQYLAKLDNAKSGNVKFSLTLRDFKKLLSTKTCYYTKTKFVNDRTSPFKRTFERLDNSIGYTKENTVVVCHCYNQLKSVIENPTNGCTFKGVVKMLNKLEL